MTEKKNIKVKEEEVEKDEKDFLKTAEIPEFKGSYIKAIGRRKTAAAQVRLYHEGAKGAIMINGKKAAQYFPDDALSIITQSLKATGHSRDFNISVIVKGGGVSAQAEAIRLGISRALLSINADLREVLKVSNFLTRDPRKKERKKPGLKAARKRPQWSKR